MALTETRPGAQQQPAVAPATEPGSIERLIGSGDHLIIGRTFIVAALIFGMLSALGLAIAGIEDRVPKPKAGEELLAAEDKVEGEPDTSQLKTEVEEPPDSEG